MAVQCAFELRANIVESSIEVCCGDDSLALMHGFEPCAFCDFRNISSAHGLGFGHRSVKVKRTRWAVSMKRSSEEFSAHFGVGRHDMDDSIEAPRSTCQRGIQALNNIGCRQDLNAPRSFHAVQQHQQLAQQRMVRDVAADGSALINVVEHQHAVCSANGLEN